MGTRALALALALGAGAIAGPFSAPARGLDAFSAQLFEPPIDPFGYVTVHGGKTLKPGAIHVAGYYDWANRPVRTREPIRDLDWLDLVASYGIAEVHEGGVEAGVVLPLEFGEGLGDLRTELKLNPFDRDNDFFGFGVRGWVDWPTGRHNRFVANDGAFSAGAEAIVEGKIDFVRGAVNLGWEWLDGAFESRAGRVDDYLRLGFAIAVAPLRDIAGLETLELAFELTHRTLSRDPWAREEEAPIEVAGAIRYNGAFFALASAGAGLTEGFGAPDARLAFALGYTF